METLNVSYKYKNSSSSDDLVCDLTVFMDRFMSEGCKKCVFFKTYMYNDLSIYVNDLSIGVNEPNIGGKTYTIPLRAPGATRGGILLSRIDYNKFKILDILLIEDTCFGKYGCYDIGLKYAILDYKGKILDFSNVQLVNNRCLYELQES